MLAASKVEARCMQLWGESWPELLSLYADDNIFARWLLYPSQHRFKDMDELEDTISKLSTWINSHRFGNSPKGCFVGDGSITCFRGGSRAT